MSPPAGKETGRSRNYGATPEIIGILAHQHELEAFVQGGGSGL